MFIVKIILATLIFPLLATAAYFMSEYMDRHGDHSEPLPDNWQTIVEDTVRADISC